MNDLIQQGKIMYWGTSEWSAEQISEAFQLSSKFNLRGPAMEQPQYNLLSRENLKLNIKVFLKIIK